MNLPSQQITISPDALASAPPISSVPPPDAPVPPPPDPILPPPDAYQPIPGYTLVEKLGEGGMGVVWRAVQQSTQRAVALKLLSGIVGSDRAAARFTREVELAASLNHPNITSIYDSGAAAGMRYYAMELIDGLPLDRYVRESHLDRAGTLRLMKTVIEAVQYAHQHGVIHRDLKPSNVLVDKEGVPGILDFGLAKAMEDNIAGSDNSRLDLTIDGDIFGTPAYMSPEQAAGRADLIDTRSDVYSLGVILFELLTRKSPHQPRATAMELMNHIVRDDILLPRDVNPTIDRELEAILLKALAKEPDRRYASAGALAADIGRYLAGEPLDARPRTLAYFVTRRLRKHRVAVTIAAIATVLTVGLAIWSYVSIAKERDLATAERHQAEQARADAERNFTSARAAVEELLAASEEDLYQRPGLQPLRARLLASAIERYRAFAAASATPAIRRELAALLWRYGFITSEMSSDTELAPRLLGEARDIQEKLLAEQPTTLTPDDQAELMSELSWTYTALSWVTLDPAYFSKIVRLRRELVRLHPDTERYRADYGRCVYATSALPPGDPAYVPFQQEALAIFSDLSRLHPDSPEYYRDRALCLRNLAMRGAVRDAIATWTQVMQLQRRALEVSAEPREIAGSYRQIAVRFDPIWGRRDLTNTLAQLAKAEAVHGQPTAAMEHARESQELGERLVAENPDMADFQYSLLETCLSAVTVWRSTNAGSRQDSPLHQAERFLDDLVATHPDDLLLPETRDWIRLADVDFPLNVLLYHRLVPTSQMLFAPLGSRQ